MPPIRYAFWRLERWIIDNVFAYLLRGQRWGMWNSRQHCWTSLSGFAYCATDPEHLPGILGKFDGMFVADRIPPRIRTRPVVEARTHKGPQWGVPPESWPR